MKTPPLGFLAFNEKENSHFRFKVKADFLDEFLREHAQDHLKSEGEVLTEEKIKTFKHIVFDWLIDSDDYKFATFLHTEATEQKKLTYFRSVELSDYWVELELAENLFVKTYVEAVEYSTENQSEIYDRAEKQIEEQLNIRIEDFAHDYEIAARILPINNQMTDF